MGWPQIATHHFIAEKDAIRGEHVGQAIIRHFGFLIFVPTANADESPQHTLQWTMRDMATWFCNAYAFWQKGGVETPIAFPHPAQARRSRVAGAPFGLDAREVDLADGEFAPRQSAALVAIERREVLGEHRQTGRHVRLERVGAKIRPRSSDEEPFMRAPTRALGGSIGAGSAASA